MKRDWIRRAWAWLIGKGGWVEPRPIPAMSPVLRARVEKMPEGDRARFFEMCRMNGSDGRPILATIGWIDPRIPAGIAALVVSGDVGKDGMFDMSTLRLLVEPVEDFRSERAGTLE